MRCRNVCTSIAAVLLLALAGSLASAQVPAVSINADENGNGSIDFAQGGHFNMPGVLLVDPGPGGLASALTYNLLGPPSLKAGDVLMLEPGGGIGDIIRFNPAGTSAGYPASLVFYSDTDGGAIDLADTGFPTDTYPLVVRINEIGGEGNNGADYHPNSDQPGFISGFDVTYHFKSDTAVPEPGAISLFAGLAVTGSFVAFRRMRRRKIAAP